MRGLRGEPQRILRVAKVAGTGCKGSVAGRSDCGLSEKVQTDLWHPPRSALDPAPDRKGREPQGDPAPDAQAESIVRFARNIVDCLSVIETLKNLVPPVGVKFEADNIYTLDGNGRMMRSVLKLHQAAMISIHNELGCLI